MIISYFDATSNFMVISHYINNEIGIFMYLIPYEYKETINYVTKTLDKINERWYTSDIESVH